MIHSSHLNTFPALFGRIQTVTDAKQTKINKIHAVLQGLFFVSCHLLCFVHAFFGTGEDVGAGSHGAADADGLAGVLVIDRDERMVRGKRAGRPFAVNE